MKAANTFHRSRRSSQGFTLLELMTAIAIMGILLSIGVPTFTNMIRGSQIAAESNDLLAALNLARSEALKRGVRVSVCALAEDLESCSDEPDWSRGWILFDDDAGVLPGTLDASDTLLQSWEAPADGVTLSTTTPVVSFSRMARTEFPLPADLPLKIQVSKAGCTGDQKREIDVDVSGRIRLARIDCT